MWQCCLIVLVDRGWFDLMRMGEGYGYDGWWFGNRG